MSTEGGILYGQWKANVISFAEDSWTTIANAVKSGSYPYKVGDTKTITLEGFGDHTVRVANTSACTNGEASETACGFVVEFADIITTYYMNPTDTNVGGYPASSMYTYLNTTIYNSIPEELRNIMIDTTVVSGHGSSDSSNFITTDKIYLLGAEEVWAKKLENSSSAGTSRQLDYYENHNLTSWDEASAYNMKQNCGSVAIWWLRDAIKMSSTSHFWWVHITEETYGLNYAGTPAGVSPAFRIG